MDDQAFLSRLMATPKAALAWGEAILSASSSPAHDRAIACGLCAMSPGLDSFLRSSLHHLQWIAACSPDQGARAADLACKVWAEEQLAFEAEGCPDSRVVGLASALGNLTHWQSGSLDSAALEGLSKMEASLLRHPLLRSRLGALSEPQAFHFFKRLLSGSSTTFERSKPPRLALIQRALAPKISADHAVELLLRPLTPHSDKEEPKSPLSLQPMDPEAAGILMTSALSEISTLPARLSRLLLTPLRRPLAHDALLAACLSSAREAHARLLALDSDASIPRAQKPRLPKALRSSRPPIGLAMELIFSESPLAALEALRWSRMLGAPGRGPGASRRDGLGHLASNPIRPQALRSGWRSGASISCESPSVAALLMGQPDLAARIHRLGWSLPKARALRALSQELASIARSAKPHAEPGFPALGCGPDMGDRFMAIAERALLDLSGSAALASSSAMPSRAPRSL